MVVLMKSKEVDMKYMGQRKQCKPCPKQFLYKGASFQSTESVPSFLSPSSLSLPFPSSMPPQIPSTNNIKKKESATLKPPNIVKRIEELEKMTNATNPNILVVVCTDFEKAETASYVHS